MYGLTLDKTSTVFMGEMGRSDNLETKSWEGVSVHSEELLNSFCVQNSFYHSDRDVA